MTVHYRETDFTTTEETARPASNSWKNTFQLTGTIKVTGSVTFTLMEVIMARLRSGEKDQNEKAIQNLLRYYDNGLAEQEIAEMTGMDRRCLNNYLRDLEDKQKAYREKRLWFAER